MEEKETISDICERLRDTGYKCDCEQLVEMWGLKCNDFKSCGECGHAFYGGLADRIEAAHQREVARRCGKSPDDIALRYNMQTYDVLGNERSKAVENLEKMDLDTGGAIKKLAVALGVDWNAANADKSVALLKERIIHLLGGRLGEGEEPTAKTYTGLTVKMGKPAEASDHEDTREKVEGDALELLENVRMYGHKYAGDAEDEIAGLLDRQAAITERNCRAEYEDMRDYLQAQVDRLQGEVDHLNKAPEAYRLANEALREQNMELRRTIDDLHERYANTDAVNGLVEHANDRLKVEADRQRDALERCRLAYETVRGLFDGWDG